MKNVCQGMKNGCKVKDLVKRYGDLVALDHLSLSVSEGEVFGLLGPNGSEKTTAINCILSCLSTTRGDRNFRPAYDAGSVRYKA